MMMMMINAFLLNKKASRNISCELYILNKTNCEIYSVQ